jgi:hypothetical protein
MSTGVTIQTTNGAVVHGINYSISTANLPASVAALAASMPGGMTYGVYHMRGPRGWVDIPANQISSVLALKPGAST